MTNEQIARIESRPEVKRFPVLGVEVEALSMGQLNAIVADAIGAQRKIVIGNHNLHSIYHYYHDPKMRRFYAAADHIHVDGMAVIGLGRMLGAPLTREHRTTYVDWMEALAKNAAEQGWRVFYLGSRPGVGSIGAEVLQRKYPGLQLETAHGYFDADPNSEEARKVIEEIEAYRPDLLITGMGMPRQEHWILDHLDILPACVILNGGAVMDYFAGVIPTPPRWAGRLALEWLFRLGAEPRRLWSRYLVEPWFILYALLTNIVLRRRLTYR